MTNTKKSKISFQEIMSWFAIIIVTAIAFFCTYYYQFPTAIVALIWIGWLVLSLVFGFFTAQGKKVYSFSKEAKVELQKVVWPTRQETVQTTSIVMIMVAVTGFILWGVDTTMMWAIGKLTHLG